MVYSAGLLDAERAWQVSKPPRSLGKGRNEQAQAASALVCKGVHWHQCAAWQGLKDCNRPDPICHKLAPTAVEAG